MRYLPLILLIAVLAGALPVHADRDIVYSARYYAPPGSHRTSHFHLYRINPDGSGKRQLTFGNSDEVDPQWSPDGRRILFVKQHSLSPNLTDDSLCILSPSGSVRALLRLGRSGWEPHTKKYLDYDWQDFSWASDSRAIFLTWEKCTFAYYRLNFRTASLKKLPREPISASTPCTPDGRNCLMEQGDSALIRDRKTGENTKAQVRLEGAVWLTDQSLAALDIPGEANQPATLRIFDIGGREKRRVPLKLVSGKKSRFYDLSDVPNDLRSSLSAIPGDSRTVLAYYDAGNSTVRPFLVYFLVDTQTGAMREFVEAQFILWNADGTRFCFAPPRWLSSYARRKVPLQGEGSKAFADYRQVWTAPLKVGSGRSGRARTITPGLVWVMGADWRRRWKG